MPDFNAEVRSEVKLELRSSDVVLLSSTVTSTVNETSVPDDESSSVVLSVAKKRLEVPKATPLFDAVTSVMEDSSSTKLSEAAKAVL